MERICLILAAISIFSAGMPNDNYTYNFFFMAIIMILLAIYIRLEDK